MVLSYVWDSAEPFRAGTGGTENYTVGHIRELRARGIDAQIITVGHGKNDGRLEFKDIPFFDIPSAANLSDIDHTLIFATPPKAIPTKRKAYAILHCPLTLTEENQPFYHREAAGKKLIAPSHFAAKMWAQHLGKHEHEIPVAYPFADQAFAAQPAAPRPDSTPRVLFASRLTPDKGIYTLLAALHLKLLRDMPMQLTVTDAGAHSEAGKIIYAMLKTHPIINLIPARPTTTAMAELLANYDVVVMPSVATFWYESFGMLSVEAQHAGCRVVASNAGGLPETDCGGLVLVEPDNPLALAKGILQAMQLGRLTALERQKAATKFSVQQSVDALLSALGPEFNQYRRQ